MSLTIYEMDANRVYTGNSKKPGLRDPIPRNWTHIAPPDGPGYHIFDGVKWFTRDEYPYLPQTKLEPEKRHITVGAFFDRFGDQKWQILSSDNPLVSALIQDCSVRKYIDLDHPSLETGMDILVDAGFTIDPEAVLGNPIEDIEKP